jgi:flagella basal body P-ring formation protein FlgA
MMSNRPILAAILLPLAALLCLSLPQIARAQDGGDDFQAQTGLSIQPQPDVEKFIAPIAVDRSFVGGTLILRPDATVSDAGIKLKNICRWPDSDAAFFAGVAELTISRFNNNQQYARITLDQIRATLRDAGINLALVSIGGATTCAVNRAGVVYDERSALEDWIDGGKPVQAAATESPAAMAAATTSPDPATIRSLRMLILGDLCRRMSLDPKVVEMMFNSADDKVLNLAEPYFQFELSPRQVRQLSNLAWDVVITAGGEHHKVTISASARIWQTQAVMINPLDYRQVIRPQDVEEKRVLTDQLPSEPLLTRDRAIGQEAARNLKPGAVLTASMVDPALLARTGQLITVNVIHGRVRLTAVAKAIDNGSFGQTIRVRSDIDPLQIFDVTLTGPQEGTVTGVAGSSDQNQSASPIAAVRN